MYIAGVNRSVDSGNTYFHEIVKLPISGRIAAIQKLERASILRLSIADGSPLQARIEYARWIVDCPNCHSAEFAFEDNLFFCSLCKNSDVQGKARRVIFPGPRLEIETTLGKRPIINRHWYPGETVESLQEESKRMGIL